MPGDGGELWEHVAAGHEVDLLVRRAQEALPRRVSCRVAAGDEHIEVVENLQAQGKAVDFGQGVAREDELAQVRVAQVAQQRYGYDSPHCKMPREGGYRIRHQRHCWVYPHRQFL